MWRAPYVSLVVVVGIAAGVIGSIAPADLTAAAILLAAIGLTVDRRRTREIVLPGVLFVAAAAHGALARDRALASPLQTWFDSFAPDDHAPEVVVVHGMLVDDASPVESGVRLSIDVDRICVGTSWRPAAGRLQAHVSGSVAASRAQEWTAGRDLTAPVFVRRPQILRNPGSPPRPWQQLRRTADLVGTIKTGAVVEVRPGRWWNEAAARARRRVRDAASLYVAPRSAQSASIVAAILIGDRAGLTDAVQRRLQAAGTYHVIAISGGNVALLTTFSFLLLRLIVRSPRAVSSLTILIVVWYGWLVGGDPSVRRAVTGAVLYLGLGLVGLRPRPLYVLSATALAVAAADPLTVLDAGAWLSFGATFGIIVCAGRFVRWATAGDRSAAANRGAALDGGLARLGRAARRLWMVVLGLFGATLAAEAWLLPISIHAFSRISLFGLVLNFVAIPAMAVVQVAGLATTLFAACWDRGAVWSGMVADVAARALVDSSRVVDAAPWLVWRVPPASLGWTVAFYAAFGGALATRASRRARTLAAAAALALAVIIVTAPGITLAAPARGRLRVTMLDVGQGDSILVQFPEGQSLLVDAGGAPGAFDVGGRVVTPALWASGVRRLDWLAFTHADLDHIGGALAVARDVHPREIWEGIPVPANPERLALRREADVEHAVWRQLLAGHSFEVGSVVVDVVSPPVPEWERRRVRNDDSVVMRLRFGDVELLLTGDAGQEFEGRTAAGDGPNLPLRLLKVGHHGSRSSSSAGFLDRFRPQAAFISVGRGNLFGHPAPDVLARYEALGALVFRTDRDGAIVIESDGAAVDVTTMSGRSWRMEVRR